MLYISTEAQGQNKIAGMQLKLLWWTTHSIFLYLLLFFLIIIISNYVAARASVKDCSGQSFAGIN